MPPDLGHHLGDALGALGHGRGPVVARCGREPAVPAGGAAQGGRALAADPDGDARALERAWCQRDPLDDVVLPAVSNRFARQESIQYRESLVEHGGALLRIARLAEGGELLRHSTET